MKSIDNAQIQRIDKPNSSPTVLATLKEKLFERFLEYRQSAPEASTLALAGFHNDELEAATLTLTWSTAAGAPQTAFGQIEPCSSPRLFELRDDFASPRQSKIGGLPFADGEFDWVFCDGVIEHVGPLERQYLLLNELNRVARRGIFVTAVNRWHPLEFHSGLPLVHWLPDTGWRRALKWFGKRGHAGARLSLVGSKELGKLASLLPRSPSFSIGHIRHLGIKAAFFLQVRKPPYDSL